MLLLPDQIDSFWVTAGVDYQGKPFKSVTQGMADLDLIPLPEGQDAPAPASDEVGAFIGFVKTTLGDAVADVRASDRLTESAVCLVASDQGMDRRLEMLLAKAGQLPAAARPVLEINPRHALIARLAALGESEGVAARRRSPSSLRRGAHRRRRAARRSPRLFRAAGPGHRPGDGLAPPVRRPRPVGVRAIKS